MNRKQLEREFFRKLNALIEPAVRKGLGSSRITPTSMIVLETTGYSSGRRRRTPLLAMRLGSHLLVATVRGENSFWIKNLRKQPRARYYLGGKPRESTALVLSPDKPYQPTTVQPLPPILAKLLVLTAPYTRTGWAFAVLMPTET